MTSLAASAQLPYFLVRHILHRLRDQVVEVDGLSPFQRRRDTHDFLKCVLGTFERDFTLVVVGEGHLGTGTDAEPASNLDRDGDFALTRDRCAKRSHECAPRKGIQPSPALTRSGVNGRVRRRAPVAAWT